MMLLKRASWVGVAVALALVAGVGRAAAPDTATASPTFVAGNLSLQGRLRLTSTGVTCPPEAPSGAIECRARTGSGSIPGLGGVSETYLWSYGAGSPPCPATLVKPLATTGRFVVAGKGEINFALAQGARCVDVDPYGTSRRTSRLSVVRVATKGRRGAARSSLPLAGALAPRRGQGQIAAPGLEFDVTPPTLSGATSKTVRAPRGARRVRVTYKVTASDNVDAQVPVTCTPRSGSRFPIGRTVVSCSATDSSANTGSTSFRITVRKAK